MPTINRLSPITPSGGLQIPVYSSDQGDARRISLNDLLGWFAQNFASPDVSTSVYTPVFGPWTVDVPNTGSNQWLMFQPSGTQSAGAITLPLNTTVFDGMEITVSTTHQITGFTINTNGAFAYGMPTILYAAGFFKIRFIKERNSWYRIG